MKALYEKFTPGGLKHAKQKPLARIRIFSFSFLLICAGFSLPCFAQFPAPTDFNTGNNGAGGKTALLQPDLKWEANFGTTTGPSSTWVSALVCGNQAPGAWINSPYSNADWITFPFTCSPSPANHSCHGLVDVFFRYKFNLPPTGPCGQPITDVGAYTLALQFYVDNAAYTIKLNGVTKYSSPAGDPYNYVGFGSGGVANMNVNSGFIAGENVILVHTKSGPGATGFLAQASTTADSDTDGVADISDRCPCQAGTGANNGCTNANVAPVVSTTSTTNAFTNTPIVVDANISVTDLENNTTLGSGKVSITTNFQAAEDQLSFTNDGSTMGNITASYAPGTGILSLSSSTSSASTSQWQAAMRAVKYNNSSLNPIASERVITFTVNDGLVNSTAATKTVFVSFNVAPVMISSSVALAGLVEDVLDVDNTGILVSDLLSGSVSDDDGNGLGIAVVSRDHANGTWQFFEGVAWWNFDRHAEASETKALLLSPSTKIRFLPATNYNGPATFTYRVWDQTTGVDHGIANTTSNGGNFAFSTGIGTAHISISSINDAPIINSLIGIPTLAFDGANDHVSFPSPTISGDFTIEAWINVTQNQTWSRILDIGNGPGNNNVVFGFFGGSYQLFLDSYNGGSGRHLPSPSTFPTGVWKHVAAVNNGAGMGYLYIDGVQVAAGTQNTIPNIVRDLNYLAKSNWGQDAYFKGFMREIRIWDVARTQSQISQNMNNQLSGNESGLSVYYKTEENAGTLLTDASGKGINGTLENGTAWSTFGAPLTTLTVVEDTDKFIPGFQMVDPDAGNNNVSLTITSTNGKIKFLQNIAGGLVSGDITGNNSYSVTVTSTIEKINKTLDANGFLYAPDLNYNGTGQVDMELSDNGSSGVGGVFSSTYSFDVTVTPVNEVPEITSTPELSVNEDEVYSYTVKGIDTNDLSDILTYSASVIPSWLTIDAQTGLLTGTPDNENVGTHEVTVRVFDGTVYAVQEFTISVLNVNDQPTIDAEQFFSFDENTGEVVVGTLTAHDVDGPTTFSSWTIVGGNVNDAFSINPATGEITVKDPNALDFETTAMFLLEVSVSDGTTASVTQTITIKLKDVNEQPTITSNQVLTINENSIPGTTAGTIIGADADEASTLMGWTITSGNTDNAFSINAATGEITVNNAAALDYEGITAFVLELSVTDGDLTSAVQTVRINLNNVNDNVPVITTASNFNIDEDKAIGTALANLEVSDADLEISNFTWTILSGNVNNAFSIDPATGEIIVNTELDYETITSYSLEVSVSDGANTSLVQTIIVNINDINISPTALSFSNEAFDPSVTPEDALGMFTTTDIDDTEFVYELIEGSGNQNNGMFILVGNKLYLKDNRGLSGLTSFTIRVRSTDSFGNTVESEFTIHKSGYDQVEIAIPGTFSPNGDGINDTWVAGELRFYNDVMVEIFDRSGVPLFKTTNPELGWDGKANGGRVLEGPFFYIIHINDVHTIKKGVIISLK